MDDGLCFIEIEDTKINKEVLLSFESGHPCMDDFLHNDCMKISGKGEGVTYILVQRNEYEENNISIVFAFATIATMGLMHMDDIEDIPIKDITKCDRVENISCLEIKYFAIHKRFRGAKDKNYNRFSFKFFNILLQNLYIMSMRVIGFKMLFLRSNIEGMPLYSSAGFKSLVDYIIPYDKVAEGCEPMGLSLSELNCW